MNRRFMVFILAAALLGAPLSGCAGSKPEETMPETTLQQTAPPQNATTAPTTRLVENQPESENCVHAQWAEDVFSDLSDYERFIHGMDEELPLVYFSTEQTVTDFKVLSLTFESADDDGNVKFAVEETYDHGTMTPVEPLLVRMELIGTIPTNGISYVDANGKIRYFSVNVSGYDGSVLLTEFTPHSIMPKGISFEAGADIVGVGRTVEVPFVLYPQDAASDTLEASVDNSEIASVSLANRGGHILQITGIVPGEVTLTLKSGETISATKKMTVAEVMPEKISIMAEPQAPRVGSSGVFTVAFDPPDATNRDVSWKSDAPRVIQVSSDGSYTAHSIGEAAITATHKSGATGTIRVEVLPIEVEAVTLGTNREEGKPFCKNDSLTLIAKVNPENATEKSLTWYSSDESVATVSSKGVVTAISPGTTVITAEAANGITGAYEIVVDISPQKFRVSASISMKSNDHVGNRWTSGLEFNDQEIRSGSTVSIMPGETFTVCGWAQDNDSKPDYGCHWERLTLTDEMCKSGFTVEGEANVYENSGRYSGNCAVWYVKVTFTLIN